MASGGLALLEIALDILDRDGGIVDQDADGKARPPRVMMLMVSCGERRTDTRIESGIEIAMISVLRQLPRKIRIINPVRHAARIASRTTPVMAARTKMD